MKTLNIDIETYSGVDVRETGVYRYAEDPAFEILLIAYSVDEGPVRVVDIAQGEHLPDDIYAALTDPSVTKRAFNASFERVCLGSYYIDYMDPASWECTLVLAAIAGLPTNLDRISKALQVEEKDSAGKSLIRYFCGPCRPSAANGYRERNRPSDAPEKWAAFIKYCRQDVVSELAICKKLERFRPGAKERRLWVVDQAINDRGAKVDRTLIKNALAVSALHTSYLIMEAIELTELKNPNSTAQLKTWLWTETGDDVDTLRKDDIPALIASTDSQTVKRVLEIRLEMNKASVKKYAAMAKCVCGDGRIRGLLQFYGANRTGRWAGRLVQVQNLRKNSMKELGLARQILRSIDASDPGSVLYGRAKLQMTFGNVPDTLSQLIRTAFVAPRAKILHSSDYSAIEARVIAWLAGESWRLAAFARGADIYVESAARMFKVPADSITKGSELREKGKIAELALGFGGSVNAMIKMGALQKGLTEKELSKIVALWRIANPAIVKLWADVESAAKAALNGETVHFNKGIVFDYFQKTLRITLPSGRSLHYWGAQLTTGKFGSKAVRYMGADQTTKKWTYQETYGGKLTENIVQAIARDCLAEALLNLGPEAPVILHVHDEINIEADISRSVEDLNKTLSTPIFWAKDLNLPAAGYATPYYKKDD